MMCRVLSCVLWLAVGVGCSNPGANVSRLKDVEMQESEDFIIYVRRNNTETILEQVEKKNGKTSIARFTEPLRYFHIDKSKAWVVGNDGRLRIGAWKGIFEGNLEKWVIPSRVRDIYISPILAIGRYRIEQVALDNSGQLVLTNTWIPTPKIERLNGFENGLTHVHLSVGESETGSLSVLVTALKDGKLWQRRHLFK